jgi:hypothetical protein
LLALNVNGRGVPLGVPEEAERPALAELRGVPADDLAHRRGVAAASVDDDAHRLMHRPLLR